MQTRIESASYTVVARPCVKIFSAPALSSDCVGERPHGAILSTTLRTYGESTNEGWVRLSEVVPASSTSEGWMLIDATLLGLGVQLEKKAFERSRLLKWWVAHAEVEVRDEIKGVVVGHRGVGRLLRTDLEMSGWVRLTEDLRRPARDAALGGEADVCEGWFSLAANDCERWRPPAERKGAQPPESLPGTTHWYWVAPRDGVAVRDKPWGAVLTKREHGVLLRGDLLVDGWYTRRSHRAARTLARARGSTRGTQRAQWHARSGRHDAAAHAAHDSAAATADAQHRISRTHTQAAVGG
jgi:hypothetical protein